MGNLADSQCCKDGQNDNQFHKNKIFDYTKSLPSNDKFPFNQIPEIVIQKLKKFHIDEQKIRKGSLRQYRNDRKLFAYLVHNLNSNQAQNEQFILKPDQNIRISNHSLRQNDKPVQQSQNNLLEKNNKISLQFQKCYYGKINKKMQVSDGILINPNGEVYQGHLKNLQIEENYGIMKNADQNHSYQGQWKNGKPHGSGTQIMKDRYEFTGNFQHGKWQGKGKLTLFSHNNAHPHTYEYNGIFKNGLLQGMGNILQDGRQMYEGEFLHNKQHGKGKWIGANGESYQGQFIEGIKKGFGVYRYNLNKRYEGQFDAGKPDGQGVLYENNKVIKGLWVHGQNLIVYDTKQLRPGSE